MSILIDSFFNYTRAKGKYKTAVKELEYPINGVSGIHAPSLTVGDAMVTTIHTGWDLMFIGAPRDQNIVIERKDGKYIIHTTGMFESFGIVNGECDASIFRKITKLIEG